MINLGLFIGLTSGILQGGGAGRQTRELLLFVVQLSVHYVCVCVCVAIVANGMACSVTLGSSQWVPVSAAAAAALSLPVLPVDFGLKYSNDSALKITQIFRVAYKAVECIYDCI